MTHHLNFSMGALHNLNSFELIQKMYDVYIEEIKGANYSNRHFEMFSTNLQYGVLAIYSINSAYEAYLNTLCIYNKISPKISISSKIDSLSRKKQFSKSNAEKLMAMRKLRNVATHWNEDVTQLLGSVTYLPYHFHEVKESSEDTKQAKDLIRFLGLINQRDLIACYDELQNLIKLSIDNINKQTCLSGKEYSTVRKLQQILEHQISSQ